jgi:hypothetical protein
MAQTGAGSWDPGMRVGDADRERTVEQLREHHAAGRLTMDEFEERMRKAYDSKTYGDLAQLTRDLPIDLARIGPGADARARYQVQGRGPGGSELGSFGGIPAMRFRRGRLHNRGRFAPVIMSTWLSMSVFLTGIWLITALAGGGWALSGFWPIWPIGITGLILLTGRINGRDRR